jgi:membrane-associated phospholipid phosphatase
LIVESEMAGMMKPGRRLLPLAVAAGIMAQPVQASDKGWDDASSVARDILVAAALGVPAVQGDWNGALQAGGSMVVAGGATYALKKAFPETRPDRSDRQSFPSGHTSVAFAAAATLENRYGWEAGLPAHLAAIFVGVARVKARKHHWYDVVAGSAVGEISGLLITRKRDDSVQFFPWADHKAGGIAVAARF